MTDLTVDTVMPIVALGFLAVLAAVAVWMWSIIIREIIWLLRR
jgi:hypothetical protein